MRRLCLILSVAASLVLLGGCKAFSSLLHDDRVVAKFGDRKLYASEVERIIPDYCVGEDSLAIARKYIETWAAGYLYGKMASEQLSLEEQDVSSELEEYRKSLLKYRCERKYVNSRLDTLVTDQQIEDYYNDHIKDFELSGPVVRFRFADILKDSPRRNGLLRVMSSTESDYTAADSVFISSAIRYFDSSDTWVDFSVLAKEFGAEPARLLSSLNGGFIKLEPSDSGDLLVAYICDIRRSGAAPLDFCKERIRDIILGRRKNALLSVLERDLLEDALEEKTLVIYE